MLTLYADIIAEKLVQGPNSTTPLSSLIIGQQEIKPVAIVFLNPTGNNIAPYDVVPIPPGFSQIILAGAAQSSLGTLLFSGSDFIPVGEGDDLQYQGTLNLNTVAINTAFAAASASTIPIYMDMILTDDAGDDEDRVVKLQPGSLLAAIWTGAPAAVDGNPYPPPASVLTRVSGLNVAAGISGLVGGAPANLDGYPTTTLTPGQIWLGIGYPANSGSIYALLAGDANPAAGDVTPLDSYAVGTLTLVQPSLEDNVTIAPTVYEFVEALTGVANEVLIGENVAATIANLIGAIMAAATGGQAAGTTYGLGTVANASATAVAGPDNTILVTALTSGSAANSLLTTTNYLTGGNGFASPTLLGGRDVKWVKIL